MDPTHRVACAAMASALTAALAPAISVDIARNVEGVRSLQNNLFVRLAGGRPALSVFRNGSNRA